MATKLATDGGRDILGKRYLSANDDHYSPSKTDFEKVKKRLKLDDHHDSSDRSNNSNKHNNNANIPIDQKQTANMKNSLFMPCHLSILKSLYMSTCGTKIAAAITSPSFSLANQDTIDGNHVSTHNDPKDNSAEGVLEEGEVNQDLWDLVDEFLNKRHLLKTNQTQTLRLHTIQQESQRVLELPNSNHHGVSTNPLLFGDVPSSMMSSNRPHTNTHGFGTSGIGGPPPSLSAASTSSSPHHHHQQPHNPLSMMMMYSPGTRPGLPVHATSTTALPPSTPSPSWALITNLLGKKVDASRSKTKALGNRFRSLERAVHKRLKRLTSLRLSLETKQCQLEQEKAMNLLGTNDASTIGRTACGPNQKSGKIEQANSKYTNDEEKELLVIVDTKIQLWKMLSQSFQEVKL